MGIVKLIEVIAYISITFIYIYKLNGIFKSSIEKIIVNSIFLAAMIISILFFGFFYNGFIIYNILNFIAISSLCILLFSGKKNLIILLTINSISNIINCENIVFSIYVIFNKSNLKVLNNLSIELDLLGIIILLSIIIIEILSIIIVKKKLLVEENFNTASLMRINISLFTALFVNFGLLYYLFEFGYKYSFAIFVLLCTIINAGANTYIIFSCIKNFKVKEVENKVVILNEQLKSQYTHYKELENYYREVKRVKHDLNNHKNIVIMLLNNGEYEDAKKYMGTLEEYVIGLEEQVLLCKNKIIDALCLSKKKICAEKGIDIEFQIELPEKLDISEIDLCVIYGNILDNAIEACERIKNPNIKKSIMVKSKIKSNHIVITIINSKEGKTKKDGERFLTSKENKEKHGIGLYSVRKSVEKYCGDVDFDENENQFITTIVIKCESSIYKKYGI